MKKTLVTTIIALVSSLALAQEMSSPPVETTRGATKTRTAKSSQTVKEFEMVAAAAAAKKDKAPSKTPAELESEGIELRKRAAHEEVVKLTASQQSKLLSLLNEGTEEELVAIKGVAASRSKSIVAARPIKSIEDIVLLKGFGKSTFSNVVKHVQELEGNKAGPKS